ncbi:hypothetical protein KP79_PYT01699 [Mizuhopecten yessoensis]|uniref:Glutathione peroxidase n=1 Tax=Mizuhopecten yessoensis TaxID=6573 RepID=A0A210Q6L5_MIZYE|nr:hypothetical protein KP79_PYT01699 [Mizuhopecten yessoensis]
MPGQSSGGAAILATMFGLMSSVRSQALSGGAVEGGFVVCSQPSNSASTVYEYSLKDLYEQKTINFSDYRGKVLLFVNVATY